WTVLSTGKIISRNWDVVINRTRMTTEFGLFKRGTWITTPSAVTTLAIISSLMANSCRNSTKNRSVVSVAAFPCELTEQKEHADDWMLFTKNVGLMLSIDETALFNGELCIIVTNKEAKGRKGAIVAMIKGTVSE